MNRIIFIIIIFIFGVLTGGIIFSKTISRSILSIPSCESNCFKKADILAILMSSGIQVTSNLMPGVVIESDKCIGIQHWRPEGRYHIVFFPKRDVRNIMELSQQDIPYFLDCLALAKQHVTHAGFSNYRLISNGPALQHVSYFHFHIIVK